MATTANDPFSVRATGILDDLNAKGEHKILQVIDGPMDATVRLVQPDGSTREALCFCSNNYLGLANHPDVVEAGVEGLKKYGAGTASVRFICGTFTPHLELEQRIAEFLGVESSYTFVSCWNAMEALFPTVCEPGDAIVSDALNHACIIDAIRLAGVIKKGVKKFIYKNNDLDSLEAKLADAREATDDDHAIWVITDGVFSMEGSIADLPRMRRSATRYGAVLVVDDSHGVGVHGKTGRGTHEHQGMDPGDIDVYAGTLGKALGRRRGRLPRRLQRHDRHHRPARQAHPLLQRPARHRRLQRLQGDRDPQREPERVQRLRDNVATPARRSAAPASRSSSPHRDLPHHRRRDRHRHRHEQAPPRAGRLRHRLRVPRRPRGRGPPPLPDLRRPHRAAHRRPRRRPHEDLIRSPARTPSRPTP
jgi:glycine C-acetyltransferase